MTAIGVHRATVTIVFEIHGAASDQQAGQVALANVSTTGLGQTMCRGMGVKADWIGAEQLAKEAEAQRSGILSLRGKDG